MPETKSISSGGVSWSNSLNLLVRKRSWQDTMLGIPALMNGLRGFDPRHSRRTIISYFPADDTVRDCWNAARIVFYNAAHKRMNQDSRTMIHHPLCMLIET
jgi:hypothetical protein